MTNQEKRDYIKEMVNRLPDRYITRFLKVKKIGYKWVHLVDIGENGGVVTIELDHCISLLDQNEHLSHTA